MAVTPTRIGGWAATLAAVLAAGLVEVHGATILDPLDAPAVTDDQYRERALAFPQVGTVDGPGLHGSGVLIGDRWVLTAGHVAFGKDSGEFTLDGVDHPIARALVHPDFAFGADDHDIGLLELAEAAFGFASALLRVFPDDTVLAGRTATWVGFGQGGTGRTGAAGSPGIGRAFTNVIDGFGPTHGLTTDSFFSDFDRPDGSENAPGSLDPLPTPLEGNAAPGDSGGGVFLGSELVGIISHRAALDGTNDSDYGDLSQGVRLSRFHPWITAETGIVPVPEPRPLTLVIAGLAAWSLTSRSRRRPPDPTR